MTTLEMLHEIEKQKTIYNIHYCNAGVGICFYYPEKSPQGRREGWKLGLSTDRYYSSFEEMVEAEYKKLGEKL